MEILKQFIIFYLQIILKLIKDVWNKKLFDYILDYLPSELKNKKTIEDYMKEKGVIS